MAGRKLNLLLKGKELFVSALIGNKGLSDEEQAAKEFCEDLRLLTEVTEVRGCTRTRMGQAMIGCGIQSLKEGCDDPDEALHLAEQMLEAWAEIIQRENKSE
tara:strand:- start:627 stop:932 length:306 start_codon:yes stop_codon:yes gene_type:complete